jgi:hypothetical protein
VGPLLIGFVLALLTAAGRRSLRPVAPVFMFVLVSLVFWVLLEFGADTAITVLHQGSYAASVLMVALAALATTYLPRWLAATIIGATLLWFAIEWLPGLSFRWAQPGLANSTDWPMVGLALASVAWVGFELVRVKPTRLRSDAPLVLRRRTSPRHVVHDP